MIQSSFATPNDVAGWLIVTTVLVPPEDTEDTVVSHGIAALLGANCT
jgi:hypothetical protein